MTDKFIDVTAHGAVRLGPRIVCDGFHHEASARVQTHIHDDHMYDFDKSKGFQHIYMTEATKQLLVAERNADLPYRDNLVALSAGIPVDHDGEKIELHLNGHMLGSAQVAVELENGLRVGYSGDIGWPTGNIIAVDQLVVDATYGSPDSVREYSQEEVENRLLDLIGQRLRFGPVHILANRGTLHRALQVIAGRFRDPLVGSKRLLKQVQVYRNFGACIDEILVDELPQGRDALASGRFLRFYGKGDRCPANELAGSRIVLSAFGTGPTDPVLDYGPTSFRVALTDHADFNATLEYVKATGARFVVTDNTRGGNAITLAGEIARRLGVDCQPSSNIGGNGWGG